MKVAFGLKAHSGWAALVVLAKDQDQYVVVDRCRVELVEESWQKQPYHAAEDLEPTVARSLVKRGISAADRVALREMKRAIKREQKRDNEVIGCGVLVTDPMPDWSIDEILAVHFRMHKAEGVLFRDALAHAAQSAGLRFVGIAEKELITYAQKLLRYSSEDLARVVGQLGKSVGAPWGKDQKEAATSAMIAYAKNS